MIEQCIFITGGKYELWKALTLLEQAGIPVHAVQVGDRPKKLAPAEKAFRLAEEFELARPAKDAGGKL